MDGLSAVASGIAVVSLAIQLVDSVREIQRFLRSISDAPEELERLIDLLGQLELILDSIGKLVERQRIQSGNADIDVSPSIMTAVQKIEKIMYKLEKLIATARNNLMAKNPATKYFNRFRLACKKEDIEQFETQLHRAVSHLNLVMTTNLTALHSHGMQQLLYGMSSVNAVTTTLTQELVLLRSDITANNLVSGHISPAKRQYRQPRSSSHRSAIAHKVVYSGMLGIVTTSVYSEQDHLNEEEQSTRMYAECEKSWLIIPSFFSRCMHVRYANSFGTIERRTRTYPTIPREHPVWYFCMSGDIAGLQKLFTNREVSPYSISEHGETLFHTAVWYSDPEVCALFLNLGLGPEVVDMTGRCLQACPPFGLGLMNQVLVTYKVIATVNQDLNFSEFCPFYFMSGGGIPVEDFASEVHKRVTKENVNSFNHSPLAEVTTRMCDPNIDCTEVEKWKQIGLYLIAKQAVIYGDNGVSSLIYHAFKMAVHLHDSEILGMRLLDMLRAANVDMAEYLSHGRRLHTNNKSDKMLIRFELSEIDGRRRILHIPDKEPFSLSWDWWVDPEGSAYEALLEFKNMGPAEDNQKYWSLPPYEWEWPYFYPKWNSFLFRWKEGWQLEPEERRIAQVFQQRFECRWQKKMTKLAKIQGTYKKPKMPGTWID